jgi:hypothetical protein
MRSSGSAPAIGTIAGEDERGDRRVGREHEDSRRPHQRIDEKRHHRRVQAGDGWQTGELRVGHALRDEQRREHDPGDEVTVERGALVRTRDTDAGKPALQPGPDWVRARRRHDKLGATVYAPSSDIDTLG